MLSFESCGPGANAWIAAHFRDCIYNTRDAISFGLGLASILAWLVAQVPQFVDNIRNGSAEALSVWFLGQWFLGDTLNLLGCLIQGEQLPTTTYLAMYFVVSDVIMLMQYIYLGALQKRRERMRQLAAQAHKRHHHHHHRHHSSQNSIGEVLAGGKQAERGASDSHQHRHRHHRSEQQNGGGSLHQVSPSERSGGSQRQQQLQQLQQQQQQQLQHQVADAVVLALLPAAEGGQDGSAHQEGELCQQLQQQEQEQQTSCLCSCSGAQVEDEAGPGAELAECCGEALGTGRRAGEQQLFHSLVTALRNHSESWQRHSNQQQQQHGVSGCGLTASSSCHPCCDRLELGAGGDASQQFIMLPASGGGGAQHPSKPPASGHSHRTSTRSCGMSSSSSSGMRPSLALLLAGSAACMAAVVSVACLLSYRSAASDPSHGGVTPINAASVRAGAFSYLGFAPEPYWGLHPALLNNPHPAPLHPVQGLGHQHQHQHQQLSHSLAAEKQQRQGFTADVLPSEGQSLGWRALGLLGSWLGVHAMPGCEEYDSGDSSTSPWWCDTNAMQLLAGTALGYVSTCMYLGSRISQIYKNASRGSAEGLSIAMFCLSVTANLCTGTSIVLRLSAWDTLKVQLPWICGTFGTVGLDLMIAYQAITFGRKGGRVAAVPAAGGPLTAPLLDG